MKPFALPNPIQVLLYRSGDKVIAHNLDFDLVVDADTKEEAKERIRIATKEYVEFGFNNGLEENICRRAPQQFWDALEISTRDGEGDQVAFQPSRQVKSIPVESGLDPIALLVAYESQRTSFAP